MSLSAIHTRHSTLNTQHSTLNTQHLTLNSNRDLSAQVLHRPPGDIDAVPAQAAVKLATAARQLARGELLFSQSFRPVRDGRAVCRAGDRVFGYALGRREEARDEVYFPAGRRRDERERIERCHPLEVRLEIAHGGFS